MIDEVRLQALRNKLASDRDVPETVQALDKMWFEQHPDVRERLRHIVPGEGLLEVLGFPALGVVPVNLAVLARRRGGRALVPIGGFMPLTWNAGELP